MIYGYACPECRYRFEVIKRASEYQSDELCAQCGAISKRDFAPERIHLYGTAVEERVYNPGLGCVTNGKAHVKEICRQRGLVEIGNESPESIHKHYEKKRQENWERSWANATKGWVGNGE